MMKFEVDQLAPGDEVYAVDPSPESDNGMYRWSVFQVEIDVKTDEKVVTMVSICRQLESGGVREHTVPHYEIHSGVYMPDEGNLATLV